MTPKEKASELVSKMQNLHSNKVQTSFLIVMRQTAILQSLIAVDEILDMYFSNHLEEEYWQEVKQEIKKL